MHMMVLNRVIKTTDPIGNVTEQAYDPVGSVTKVSRYGLIGGESPQDNSGTGNVLLRQTEYFFDEMNRQYQKDDVLFISDGVSTVCTPVLKDGPLGTSNDGRVTHAMNTTVRGVTRLRLKTMEMYSSFNLTTLIEGLFRLTRRGIV